MGNQWNNAPVFYTLAQVKFNPIAQMEVYIPKLQDELRRNGYPDFKPETKIEVTIRKPDSSEPDVRPQQMFRWSFTNPNRTEGYLLHKDAIIYHSTEYEIFDDFLNKALKGLKLAHKVIELAYVERIGLRYLDAVVPIPGESIDAYLNPNLLGLSPDIENGLAHTFSETAVNIDGGLLVSRSVIAENGLAMPPDLFPMQLTMPQHLTNVSGRTAVLDNDYFVEKRIDFNLDHVEAQLRSSHDIVSATFRKVITDHAKTTWE
ncbi:MAG: TIGR04255 family protein [Candidatus Thiodiazotropha sp. (ex Lucinoma annulata)]|nr:TIGR04255 family protein [Candidatus Thiodiazotropha sp. (ex Lucinoma annulata)]